MGAQDGSVPAAMKVFRKQMRVENQLLKATQEVVRKAGEEEAARKVSRRTENWLGCVALNNMNSNIKIRTKR